MIDLFLLIQDNETVLSLFAHAECFVRSFHWQLPIGLNKLLALIPHFIDYDLLAEAFLSLIHLQVMNAGDTVGILFA